MGWSADGRQLLFVEVQASIQCAIGHDGRFVIIRRVEAEAGGGPASNLIVVQNWFEELKRLVPTK
jgi:hypothetical protein